MCKRIKYPFIAFVCLACFSVKAQITEGIYRFDTRINGLVPHPLSNKAFKSTFIGVYSVSGSQNVQLFKNFYAGICGGNSLYKIPTNKLVAGNGYRLSNQFQLNWAGLNIGYDYYFTPHGFLSTSISIGQSFGKFSSIQTITPATIKDEFNTAYLQITENINFILEDHFGIGFLVSYTYINHSFDPADIALDQFKHYESGDMNGAVSHLEVGFNLYFGYVKKKK
ncbi:MAG: autotransporter outer membrane beta-barrel domain-containing protein [Bacteroidetes bacterium]|nr:autotransporter outer membrane beta-barrel domain-containing protein [Bacteroidota bacterium]